MWLGTLRFDIHGSEQNRDDVEDAELDTAQLMEGMPTVMSGFKDHPMYVRHIASYKLFITGS